ELAARVDRAHAGYFENLQKARRRAARVALIKKRHAPVNVLSGYRFPNAPVIDLSPLPTSEWATASRWKPSGAGAEVPDIPEFLRRATAAIPTRRSEEVAAAPGDDLPIPVGYEEVSP